MRSVSRVIALGMGLAACGQALGQQAGSAASYPAKSIRMIIPFAAGGTTDVAARVIGQKLTEAWGQQVVVESRVGGGSLIGTDYVAKSAPDGYTLLVSTISFAISASLYRKVPYDPIRDFAPITQMSALPLVLVVHPSVPAKSLKELIALAKARPGHLNYASSGSGTSPHLAAEMLKSMAKIDLIHIPYKGSAIAANDLLGGHVMMNIGLLPAVLPHVQTNRIRPIAVTTTQRVAALPGVPTMAESGLPDYEINSWQGFWAPAGVPSDIIAKLHREMVRAIRLPDVRERIVNEGAVPVGSAPAEFGEHVRREITKWAQVIRQSKAQVD
jgi:tripartite-type tricarboxylate transporter receptor subunit TctC